MPPAKLEVVIVGFAAAADSLIVIENAFVAVPAELVALIVNENVPALLGVPEIKPLEVLSDKPVGKDPLAMPQVKVVELVALRAALYVLLTVPLARLVVVITGRSASAELDDATVNAFMQALALFERVAPSVQLVGGVVFELELK